MERENLDRRAVQLLAWGRPVCVLIVPVRLVVVVGCCVAAILPRRPFAIGTGAVPRHAGEQRSAHLMRLEHVAARPVEDGKVELHRLRGPQ
eukprot:1595057-Prymnesium_polylepis.1